MPRGTVESRSNRLHEQLRSLREQVSTPDSISRRQTVEALEALQMSLQELEVAEAELIQQHEALEEMQEALEIERHRYRELFELAPVAYLVTDGQGTIQTANPAACELVGRSAKALTGKPLPVLVRPEDRQLFRDMIRNLHRREEREVVFLSRQPRDEERVVLVTVQKDEDRPLQPATLRWVLRDVTEQKASEQALRGAEERLRHSQKLEAVGRLAGGVAHSFNNLLAAIALHAELLLEARGSEGERLRHAEEIQSAGERAAALARQLLAFSRKQVLQPRPLDISREIAGMVPMLRRLVGEHIELEARLDPDAGWMHGDLGQLEQVILNLVANARDAMPDGGRLGLETRAAEVNGQGGRFPGLKPGPYVEIAVRDTGTGMADEIRSRLFEPFFTTKDRDKGTGLGLATVYGIVRQSGGDIAVESRPGEGSSFVLFLPGVEKPAEQGRPEREPRDQETGSEVILFVEDEENIRHPAREVLESRGYTVLSASDAAEALKIAGDWAGTIDLLVTDVVMPGMNGSQLADEICRRRPSVKVLYISGYPEDAIARHGVLEPDRSFLQKPFPPGVLTRKVREVLDREAACSAA
ncbi:MAG: ATP-binding protein [Thermoanaerobaculia bacterium]